jgi:hypothetical protein
VETSLSVSSTTHATSIAFFSRIPSECVILILRVGCLLLGISNPIPKKQLGPTQFRSLWCNFTVSAVASHIRSYSYFTVRRDIDAHNSEPNSNLLRSQSQSDCFYTPNRKSSMPSRADLVVCALPSELLLLARVSSFDGFGEDTQTSKTSVICADKIAELSVLSSCRVDGPGTETAKGVVATRTLVASRLSKLNNYNLPP